MELRPLPGRPRPGPRKRTGPSGCIHSVAPDGRFRIEGVERGAWTLVLATVNPPDVVRAIELAPGETRSLGIRLA